ncbi:hypothetical protein [Aeromonas dhakensis]|uniref:hypothetical protein n=1 Tax=Aeromonas dhakensis TaxID=196024 RepID=UPI0028D9A243|nr:hypothetical protein [Aeromonas dhakensis]
MRSRTELLKEVISDPVPTAEILAELSSYGWDCETELVQLTQADILRVLESLTSGAVSAIQVCTWANRLEGRDDVGFEGGGEGVVNEALFWLANPEINYPIDNTLQQKIQNMFKVGLYEARKP